MGCFPFTNYHFQTGVTVMGFAEHSGQSLSYHNQQYNRLKNCDNLKNTEKLEVLRSKAYQLLVKNLPTRRRHEKLPVNLNVN